MVGQKEKAENMQNIFHPLIFPLFAKVDELFHFVALMEWDYLTW